PPDRSNMAPFAPATGLQIAYLPLWRGVCPKLLSAAETKGNLPMIPPTGSVTGDSAAGMSNPAQCQVQVRFLGILERLTGQRETQVEIGTDQVILDLLETLCQRYGEEFSSNLFRAPGKVHTYLRIFLDEMEVQPTDGFTPNSTSKMELIILPIFEGGSR
ncbi:MAG: MoaD/ThiS family protein, partial [Acidobacteriota bacterium]